MDIRFDQTTFDLALVSNFEGFLDLDIITSQSDEVMQRLFLRLKTYPRDLFWNIGYGIDYLNTVFGKNRPKSTVDIVLKNEILKEPMVSEIVRFESEIANYNYACKFSVRILEEDSIVTYFVLTNENGAILTNENGDTLTARLQ